MHKAFANAIKGFPGNICRSLTYDQGNEMAERASATDNGYSTYKCILLIRESPWERGTSENTNGLIRQFFANSTDFTLVNNEQLKRAQDLLNDRSRRVLDWKKPDEVLASMLY